MERFTTNAAGDVHFGGTYNGNAIAVEAGLATIELLEDGAVHEHVFALGSGCGPASPRSPPTPAIPAVVGGFGSLFVLCFMEGPLETYEDVLRNDTALFMRYRRELVGPRRVRDAGEPRPQPHQRGAHRATTSTARWRSPRTALAAALDGGARSR